MQSGLNVNIYEAMRNRFPRRLISRRLLRAIRKINTTFSARPHLARSSLHNIYRLKINCSSRGCSFELWCGVEIFIFASLLAENYLLNHLINLFADQTVETINNFFLCFASTAVLGHAECVPKMSINISLTH